MKYLAALGVIVMLWLHCRMQAPSCTLARAWHAARPHYDYLQVVELRADRTGELVMGEGQLVRTQVTIHYAVAGDAIRFEYVAGSHAASRSIGFALTTGDFPVVERDYDGAREHHYGCRLELAENPFPPDTTSDPHVMYYACER
ncbi:MAG: hypothetical protein ABJE66_19540 [Deltaproteobacteria bacterium]